MLSRSTQTRHRAFDSIRVVDEPRADFSFWAEPKPTQSGFPDLIDNTFGSTLPALGRAYASRVNVPVAFECQVRSGLPTVLVHFRLWRFRTRLWRIITRQRWESRHI